MAEKTVDELKDLATQVRRDIVRMVHSAQSGHPGGSLGCTELLVALYFRVMKHNPDFQMEGQGEDLFFLSNGHISPVWYSVLARAGYFDVAELGTFRQIDSRLQGHPATAEHLPGIRIASGSLGQGLSVAIGAAQAKKLNGDDRNVFVLMGDGEQEEGQVWEAVMYAPNRRVDNLIAIVDRNDQQIDGPVNEVMPLHDLGAKWAAFGWHVLELKDGNNLEAVVATLEEAVSLTGQGQPIMIVMHTEMGYGVDFMTGSHEWHGIAPNDKQLDAALGQLQTSLADY
ncbi:transketolase [Catalinimonas alkaloidigena]|uniref:Transketolase n=1 Tax=Catalinimonas alkaloidigena TaxID=1075417 RepID=A0A1G9K583_9BACT|nr:transketolase [Catalinimonas alkaloidigena]SDL44908.1 transketolase [Catalinimonas alkaloidigena]